MKKIEIYVVINEEGEYAIDPDCPSDARELMDTNFGGAVYRTVKLEINVKTPEIPSTTVDVPDDEGVIVTV